VGPGGIPEDARKTLEEALHKYMKSETFKKYDKNEKHDLRSLDGRADLGALGWAKEARTVTPVLAEKRRVCSSKRRSLPGPGRAGRGLRSPVNG